MLNYIQQWTLFVMLCLITIAAVVFEGVVFFSLIDQDPSVAKGLMAVASTGLLYTFGRLFADMIRKTFLQRSAAPVNRLHEFAKTRCGVVEDARRTGSDIYVARQQLVSNTLKFALECLQGWLRGTHFELCVFVDQEQPLLFGYYDSNHDTTARSVAERERNPHFYVEKGYEVTKLLKNPTSQLQILRDTQDTRTGYTFTSKEQRKQLRSSVLLCFDLTNPCALVISSNEKSAFSEKNPELVSFIRLIGELVRYDLFEGDFVRQIRTLKPQLFGRHEPPAIGRPVEPSILGRAADTLKRLPPLPDQ